MWHFCIGIALLFLSIPNATSFSATPKTGAQNTCSQAKILQDGKLVRIALDDGVEYDFHAMWLRDACRDDNHVVKTAGERLLTATPVGPLAFVDPNLLKATEVIVNEHADSVTVKWNEESSVTESTFSLPFLCRFANRVAKPVFDDKRIENHDDIPTWLEPFTGYPNARAPLPNEVNLWTNQDGPDFSRFDFNEIMTNDASLFKLLEKLLIRDGVVLVNNVPKDTSDKAQELHRFVDYALGGLQKDPTRNEANWKIVKTPGADSISYDPVKRLYQHTDSSIPPHGIPGLVLSMHYVKGYGANTLTDGYAVAKRLKEIDPEGYQLLCQYGYDGERDFAASRKDSLQDIAEGLVIQRCHPILVTDSKGGISRIQYNEVFRMPLTMDFQVFPKWYKAFSTFVSMIHSEEYQRTVDMEDGTILLMNNWRVLHGRAGNRASPDRLLVGGTIVREAVFSRAMQLARKFNSQQ